MTSESARITDYSLKIAITLIGALAALVVNDMRSTIEKTASEQRSYQMSTMTELATIRAQLTNAAVDADGNARDMQGVKASLSGLEHRMTVLEEQSKR